MEKKSMIAYIHHWTLETMLKYRKDANIEYFEGLKYGWRISDVGLPFLFFFLSAFLLSTFSFSSLAVDIFVSDGHHLQDRKIMKYV